MSFGYSAFFAVATLEGKHLKQSHFMSNWICSNLDRLNFQATLYFVFVSTLSWAAKTSKFKINNSNQVFEHDLAHKSFETKFCLRL